MVTSTIGNDYRLSETLRQPNMSVRKPPMSGPAAMADGSVRTISYQAGNQLVGNLFQGHRILLMFY